MTPPLPTFRVRAARPADAAALSELMAATFREKWQAEYSAADLSHYLAENYQPAVQAAQLADPATVLLVAEAVSDGALVGFARFRFAEPPPEVAAVGPTPAVELVSFYVRTAWHNQRVGAALYDAGLAAVRARSARTLWLGVFPENHGAVRFYRARGLAVVGEHSFTVGSQTDMDWWMAGRL
jgi:diamine N-acetyltransferase